MGVGTIDVYWSFLWISGFVTLMALRNEILVFSDCRSISIGDKKNLEVSTMKKTSKNWLVAGILTVNDLCVNLLSSSLLPSAQILLCLRKGAFLFS